VRMTIMERGETPRSRGRLHKNNDTRTNNSGWYMRHTGRHTGTQGQEFGHTEKKQRKIGPGDTLALGTEVEKEG